MDFLANIAVAIALAVCGQNCVVYDVPAAIKAEQQKQEQLQQDKAEVIKQLQEEKQDEHKRTDQ